MNKTTFLEQIDKLLVDYRSLKNQQNSGAYVNYTELCQKIIAKSLGIIERSVSINSTYYGQANKILDSKNASDHKAKEIIGVILSLKEDLENDYLRDYKELISGEIFSDYIEMADYLLQEEYKDASAVIIGSTLEAHLRKLCLKNNIKIVQLNQNGKEKPINSETLNQDLCKSQIYNSIRQKQITSWLGIRNDAAHGKYENYTKEQVSNFLNGLRSFIIDYPA